MRKTLQILAAIAVLCVIIACLFLPHLTAAVQDARVLGKLVIEPAQAVSFESQAELTVLDRVRLVSGDQWLNLRPAPGAGLVMDEETALLRAAQELERVNSYAALMQYGPEAVSPDPPTVRFYVDPEDPAQSVMAWQLYFEYGKQSRIFVVLDDETGTILQLFYDETNPKELSIQSGTDAHYQTRAKRAKQLAQGLALYYGIEVSAEQTASDGTRSLFEFTQAADSGALSVQVITWLSGFSFNASWW